MLKVYIVLVITLLMVGCGPEKSPKVKSSMFQSVNPQEVTLLQNTKDKNSCPRCGMNLTRYYKTSHAAMHKDKQYQYCSIHCLEDHLGEGITLKNPQVVDVDSLKFMSVSKAHYVVGSSKRGTMTRVSKYAFLDEAMAKEFQAKYGGQLMDFNGALEKAKEDFKH
ncbi:MAG: nitrous oxide reductase accessory protein NosL [Campylobacterota bacterium]|nr:nitrous oxide reductase accessory protein NosL [Campylobacterota bacterium]